ncbi:unnamed protein product [Pleuronectes platessa]|uniref:Uncharacterized protein n=1 Tax=Pleuronectes platessa TaxID=8262 RepID=A0A9N7Z396_PLEPL|nr:unnamed protein product [Pleuronectes platessa]
MHLHPGCAYPLQGENSPQRPGGERIRVEPSNFTAVHWTITGNCAPPYPSPSPHSLCLRFVIPLAPPGAAGRERAAATGTVRNGAGRLRHLAAVKVNWRVCEEEEKKK